MVPYQHVVVVISILLGLTVTQLLKGVAQLYRTRSRVRLYWLHGAWVTLLLVFSLLVWWTYWNYRGIPEWTFFRFVVYLSPMITLYFLTVIAIPDPSESVVSMKEYYFSNRSGFFGTLALYGVLAAVAAVTVRGLSFLDPSNLFRLAMVLLSVMAMRSTSERVHAVLLAVLASLLVAFVLIFHFRLG